MNLHANRTVQKTKARKEAKCKQCNSKGFLDEMIEVFAGKFCNHECKNKLIKSQLIQSSMDSNLKKWEQMKNPVKRVIKKGSDVSRGEWYKRLEALENQWIVQIRDKDEPCCTCGTKDPSIKYDAGHCFTVGARPDIRFDTRNNHKQCSIKCNVYGSGMRHEYERFIIKKYGQETLDDLRLQKKLLKDQFPHWTDIEKEVKRYRVLIREAGLKPRV